MPVTRGIAKEVVVSADPALLRRYYDLRQQKKTLAGRRMRRYFNDPVAFAHDCFETLELVDYQNEMLELMIEHKRISVRGPHALGKSVMATVAVLWFALTRDAAEVSWKAPTTATSWNQLQRYLWPEIHQWARDLRWDVIGREPFTRHELLQLNLQLTYGSAFAVASDIPANIEGVHADHVLYVFDEAKAIPVATFDAAEGAFAGAGGDTGLEALAIANSTPGEPIGRFYDIHQRKPGLEAWQPRHVTLKECIAAKRVSEDWAEKSARLWGPESAMYANRVLGEFHSSDEDAVIPLSWVELAMERWKVWAQEVMGERFDLEHIDASELPTPEGLGSLGRVGVDVAHSGEDQTALALRYAAGIWQVRYSFHEPTTATTGRVAGVLEANPGAIAVVDADGLGVSVVDQLRERGLQQVMAFKGGAATDRRDRSRELGFFNTRCAAWWHMRELLDPAYNPEVCLPPDDLLVGDLCAPHWSVTSKSQIMVEKKEDFKKRLHRSPDSGDACLAGGTLVATSKGSIPIENVGPGDRVWTRAGWRQVEHAGQTSARTALRTVVLADGRRLTGTGNHPVWDGERFRRLDAFTIDDRIAVCDLRRSSIEASGLRAIRNPLDVTSASTSGRRRPIVTGASALFMLRFGRLSAGQSQRDGTFITSTLIRSTTDQRIWHACRRAITILCTRLTVLLAVRIKSTWIAFVPWLPPGMALRSASSGTVSMGAAPGSVENRRFLARAPVAGKRSGVSGNVTGSIGVAGPVSCERPNVSDGTGETPCALSAVQLFGRSPQVDPKLALVRVVRTYEDGVGPVWNLQVRGQPEYLANGVLVHNCVQAFWEVPVRRGARMTHVSTRRR